MRKGNLLSPPYLVFGDIHTGNACTERIKCKKPSRQPRQWECHLWARYVSKGQGRDIISVPYQGERSFWLGSFVKLENCPCDARRSKMKESQRRSKYQSETLSSKRCGMRSHDMQQTGKGETQKIEKTKQKQNEKISINHQGPAGITLNYNNQQSRRSHHG